MNSTCHCENPKIYTSSFQTASHMTFQPSKLIDSHNSLNVTPLDPTEEPIISPLQLLPSVFLAVGSLLSFLYFFPFFLFIFFAIFIKSIFKLLSEQYLCEAFFQFYELTGLFIQRLEYLMLSVSGL